MTCVAVENCPSLSMAVAAMGETAILLVITDRGTVEITVVFESLEVVEDVELIGELIK
jgi:hypothetical protein